MAEVTPRITLTREQAVAAREAAAPDLRFLLDRENVDESSQDIIFHLGITTIRMFAAVARDADDFRAMIRSSGLGFDPHGGMGDRIKVAALVVAWSTAQTRAVKRSEHEAEMDVRKEPKPLSGSDFVAMREAFEKRWWEIADKRTPAKSYVERILDGIEKADLRAEPLSEVVNLDEQQPDVLLAKWDTSGNLKAVRAPTSVPLPAGTEELRARLQLLGHGWMFAGLAQPTCAVLHGVTPQLWQEYLEYVLGEFVLGLHAYDASGSRVGSPPWSLVLSYEHEMRKHMCRLMQKRGMPLPEALRSAMQDAVLKERYFTTPLATHAAAARGHAQKAAGPPPEKKARVGDKRAAPGRSPNMRREPPAGRLDSSGPHPKKYSGANSTPDGRAICFLFNLERCKKNKCKFLHVCGRCFKEHPMAKCSAPAAFQ